MPAVRETVGIRPEARGVFGVVREPVVVSVVVGPLRGDAEDVLPPIGDAVAVGVRIHRVRGVDRAVGLEAAVDVDHVGEAGLHARAVVVDERVPANRHRRVDVRRVVVAGVLLPPIGDSVAVGVGERLLPRIGHIAVPKLRTRLRVRAAERDEVGRADEVVPHLELALDERVGVDSAKLLDPARRLREAVVRVEVADGRRVGDRAVRERVLREPVLGRRGVDSAEVVAVDEAVGR